MNEFLRAAVCMLSLTLSKGVSVFLEGTFCSSFEAVTTISGVLHAFDIPKKMKLPTIKLKLPSSTTAMGPVQKQKKIFTDFFVNESKTSPAIFKTGQGQGFQIQI